MVLFYTTLVNYDSGVALYHCTAIGELSVPETLDLSHKQSVSAPETTLCKLNLIISSAGRNN